MDSFGARLCFFGVGAGVEQRGLGQLVGSQGGANLAGAPIAYVGINNKFLSTQEITRRGEVLLKTGFALRLQKEG